MSQTHPCRVKAAGAQPLRSFGREARLFVTREDHIGHYGNVCNRSRRSQMISFDRWEPAGFVKGRPSSDRGLWGGLELHVLVD
jgi:hypothetical protein